MSRKAQRRRVSIADNDNDDNNDHNNTNNNVVAVRRKKQSGNLSFASDMEDETRDAAPAASMFSLVKNKAAAPIAPVVLDIPRPSYHESDLEALKQNAAKKSKKDSVSVAESSPLMIVTGDELQSLGLPVDNDNDEEEAMDELLPGNSSKNNNNNNSNGTNAALPSKDQVARARELREKLRRQRRPDADEDAEFLALETERRKREKRIDEEDKDDEYEDDDDGEGRLVRENADDDEEPFEEHRGATIRFGVPEARVKPEQEDLDRQNAAELDEWEMEHIRQGAYERAGEIQQRFNDKSGKLRPSRSSSDMLAGLDSVDPLQPSPSTKIRAKHLSQEVLLEKQNALSAELIERNVKRRCAEAEERCVQLRQQMGVARLTADEGAAGIETAQKEVAEAAEKFDLLQRTRDYTLTLVNCVESVLPNIEALEKKVKALEEQRGAEARMNRKDEDENVDVVQAFPDLDGLLATSGVTMDAKALFADVVDDFSVLSNIVANYENFRVRFPDLFAQSHILESLMDVLAPFVRAELLLWSAFATPDTRRQHLNVLELPAFQALLHLGEPDSPATDEWLRKMIGRTAVPKCASLLTRAFDVWNGVESAAARDTCTAFQDVFGDAPGSADLLRPLWTAVVEAFRAASAPEQLPQWAAPSFLPRCLQWLLSLSDWLSVAAVKGPLELLAKEFVERNVAPYLRGPVAENVLRPFVEKFFSSPNLAAIGWKGTQFALSMKMLEVRYAWAKGKLIVQ